MTILENVRYSVHSKTGFQLGKVLALAVVIIGAATVGAHAGTDTTFATTTTQLTTWTTGSLGKLAAVAAVGFGVFGAIARFDWKLIAGGVGIGLAAATGPGIASALLSAPF